LFFDVNDETGFAHAIVRLANDSEFRSALIEKGLQNLWRYRPDIMISRYISLYEQVLSAQENTACAAARV
jgi:glycosyltransferase involved in cell wall biosynthesis